jgi:hypothetical protein
LDNWQKHQQDLFLSKKLARRYDQKDQKGTPATLAVYGNLMPQQIDHGPQ